MTVWESVEPEDVATLREVMESLMAKRSFNFRRIPITAEGYALCLTGESKTGDNELTFFPPSPSQSPQFCRYCRIIGSCFIVASWLLRHPQLPAWTWAFNARLYHTSPDPPLAASRRQSSSLCRGTAQSTENARLCRHQQFDSCHSKRT